MKNIQLIIICILLSATSFAQQTVKPAEQFPNTIKGQFQKLYKRSSNYQIFKVIKKEKYLTLQKNVLDSISTIQKDVITKQQTITTQQKNINDLEAKIKTLNNNLSVSTSKEDTISLFGADLSKATYNTILWGIIAALLAGLLFFTYKFNNSNSLTKEAKLTLENVEEEFETHRKKSIEREQKLRRQLQDEINKQRGV